ncbi:MAG TPA: diheme cytochrome c-553 [Chryseolinea sp.]|nr:diheme cytochrome c-553 [Chryseolinea sp.]
MKKKYLLIGAALTAGLLAGCIGKNSQPTTEQTILQNEETLIERGKYLVTISGCNDCHSPKIMSAQGPEPDPSRLLSGHIQDEKLPPMHTNAGKDGWVNFNMNTTAAVGPWGVSFAANLTPDETGIGTWTFEQFKTAIQKGKYKGLEESRMLLPPMPWQVYKNIKEDDLKAIYVYLKSLPPINNLVPQPILSTP